MKHRFFTLIFGVLLCLFSLNLRAQGFGLLIDSITVQSGQDFCVSVKTKGYSEIVSLQAVFSWDAQMINFKQTKGYNLPGLNALEFVFISPNHLLFGWSNPTGVCISRDSGETLFEVCFSTIGPGGNNTFITLDSGEAGDCLGQFGLVPIVQDTGLVIISTPSGIFEAPKNEANTFQLSPNPTSSSAQAIFQSSSTGCMVLLVTDAIGRTVFTQKIIVNAGENRIEIPAKTLNTKGMYQVSVQTDKGVSSQMLSVN